MINQPFKFRYVNTIAGAFVLLCGGLLVAGVLIAGRAQGWFEGRLRLIAEFTTMEGAYGLQEGAEIRIMDTTAGRVQRIEPSDEGVLQAELLIRDRFAGLINRGSSALVKLKIAGLAGDAYVDISTGGQGYEPFESGDRIPITKDVELVEMALAVVNQLQEHLIPLVDETRGILENVNQLTRAIDEGEGPVGMLLKDEHFAAELRDIVESARRTAEPLPAVSLQFEQAMEHVGQTLTNVLQASANVNVLTAGLADEVQDVRGLMWELTETVRELGVVMRGLQNHWLLRRHVPSDEPFALPAPSDIGGGSRGNRP